MGIISISSNETVELTPLVAEFRKTLLSFKGTDAVPDMDAAKEEIQDYLKQGYPIFAAEENGILMGYVICRIEEPCLWVEQIYVREGYRRKGIASMLFDKAEEIAGSMGEETVFNYVHPNNHAMIQFLRSKGYTVLNLIEIRRPYRNEKLSTVIHVGDSEFDY